MKKNILYFASFMLLSSLIFSCSEYTDDNLNLTSDITEDTKTAVTIEEAEDYSLAEDLYTSVDAMVEDEVMDLDVNNYSTEYSLKCERRGRDPFNCKTVTVDYPGDSTRFPKVITIDYGDSCTVTIHGEEYTRSGKIQITITDRWFVEGATRTTTFIDFYINNIKVEGTRTVENLGLNERNNMEFYHTLEGGKLIFSDTLIYTREAERTHEWVRDTLPVNDVWLITGSSSGTTANNQDYASEITDTLRMIRCPEYNYQWQIVEGVIEFNIGDIAGSLNYGDGSCDNSAILTVDGVETEIDLHRRYHRARKHFRHNLSQGN